MIWSRSFRALPDPAVKAIPTTALVLALPLMLVACAKPAPAPPREGAPDGAVRVVMPEGETMPVAATPAGETPRAAWDVAADGLSARHGFSGTAPQVSVLCRSGMLVVTRHAAAPLGAQALFALVGSKGILRLPVDATPLGPGRGYIWQGTLPASDPRAEVLAGAWTGTLPGAGMIKAEASSGLRDLVTRCRGAAPTAAPEPVSAEQVSE